jgi:lipoate-protein ligase B
MEYRQALEIQRSVHAFRRAGKVPDVVLTVEHDPVFTRGRTARPIEYRVSLDAVRRAGIPVVDVERGGDVTYHGPGQLVAYPIVDLRQQGRDVKRYVETIEGAVIDALAAFGIEASRRPALPGVWVREGKIASIGVYVKDWVTRHGLALNVGVDPAHFGMIHPCGLPVRAVSMNELLERPVPLEDVEVRLVASLARGLGWRVEPRGLEELEEHAGE